MEQVIVKKDIPGLLYKGEILTLNKSGDSFILETGISKDWYKSERYVNLDFVTVSENIPEYFDFVTVDLEDKTEFEVKRSKEEIFDRYTYFLDMANLSDNNTESKAVYTNLVWFMDWLAGNRDLF